MASNEIALSENMKTEFKTWLNKYQKELRLKNQSLKSTLKIKEVRNNELKFKIEKPMDSSLITSTIVPDAIPNESQTNIETNIQYLKSNSIQLKICNQEITTNAQQESKRIRQKFRDILTKDKVTLKPYHEVEQYIKQTNMEIESLLRQQDEERQRFIQILNNRAQDFLQIKENFSSLEPIEHDIRLEFQATNKSLEDKMKSLKLQSIEETNHESNEAKELLNDIKNLEKQANM